MNTGSEGHPRLVFVGGHQRSGTTLLASLISQHSAISGLTNTGFPNDEGQFLQSVYTSEIEMGSRRFHTVRWGFHPAAHLTEGDAERLPGAAAQLLQSWRDYWEDPGATYFVEKTPSNISRIRFLYSLFPDAKFVIITRHPAIQALAVRKWSDMPARVGLGLTGAIDHWLYVMERFQDDLAYVPDVLVCRYEDLVRDPVGVMGRVFDHVGVPQQSVVGIRDVTSVSRYDDYWRYLLGVPQQRFKSLNDGTRLRNTFARSLERIAVPTLGRWEARHIVATYGERVSRFGYKIADPST